MRGSRAEVENGFVALLAAPDDALPEPPAKLAIAAAVQADALAAVAVVPDGSGELLGTFAGDVEVGDGEGLAEVTASAAFGVAAGAGVSAPTDVAIDPPEMLR
jgi:hypothetical protein